MTQHISTKLTQDKQSPLLSICCLGYNHASFLQETLDSIEQIKYASIEVIVVDDGSKDNSVELLDDIKKNYHFDIHIINQANTGNIGKNFNNAFKVASGDLIAFIALDDVFHSDVMTQQIQVINNDENLAFVASSDIIAINDNGYINPNLPKLPLHGLEKPSVEQLLEFEYNDFGSFYLQGCIFRHHIIDSIGGFDEDMTGDDIIIRTKIFRYMLANPHWGYHLMEKNNVFYRIHDNNVHKNTFRQIKIVTEYLQKYWPERENPQELYQWVKQLIETQPFKHSIEVFTLNTRAASLLKNEDVQKHVSKALKKENSLLHYLHKNLSSYLYKKERLNHNTRRVTLLSFITFNYSRSTKENNSVHYKDIISTL